MQDVYKRQMDNSYALWRNTNDSLRKRLGDLRFRDNTVDGDGIWARYSGGKFAGSGNFDGSFNMYQLGYDKAANAKSIYGFAVENGSGHTSYSYGSGKDLSLIHIFCTHASRMVTKVNWRWQWGHMMAKTLWPSADFMHQIRK